MNACPHCGAELGTPFVCEACDRLLQPDAPPTPFEAFGLETSFAVDTESLRKRLLRLSRRLHPDFHTGAGADVRRLAEEGTGALNTAHELLRDPRRRADWIVRRLGGPAENDERQMPQEFLMEVLEWNEAVEEARAAEPGSPARERLQGLSAELAARREDEMGAVAGLLEPLPAPGSPALTETRRHLNAVRYLDRTLHEISELRLAQEASRPD